MLLKLPGLGLDLSLRVAPVCDASRVLVGV